jgi:hypothetical protein
MGENKKIRKQILGHEKIIEVHRFKILEELKNEVPNYERIRHWEMEILTFQKNIEKLLEKLNK